MGANQSTRKLTVVSDEATGVVKISDSVLERLKGEISGEKKEASPPPPPPAPAPTPPQPEPQREPEAAAAPPQPAAPVAPPAEEIPAPSPAAPPAAPPVEHVQSQEPINIHICVTNSLRPADNIQWKEKVETVGQS